MMTEMRPQNQSMTKKMTALTEWTTRMIAERLLVPKKTQTTPLAHLKPHGTLVRYLRRSLPKSPERRKSKPPLPEKEVVALSSALEKQLPAQAEAVPPKMPVSTLSAADRQQPTQPEAAPPKLLSAFAPAAGIISTVARAAEHPAQPATATTAPTQDKVHSRPSLTSLLSPTMLQPQEQQAASCCRLSPQSNPPLAATAPQSGAHAVTAISPPSDDQVKNTTQTLVSLVRAYAELRNPRLHALQEPELTLPRDVHPSRADPFFESGRVHSDEHRRKNTRTDQKGLIGYLSRLQQGEDMLEEELVDLVIALALQEGQQAEYQFSAAVSNAIPSRAAQSTGHVARPSTSHFIEPELFADPDSLRELVTASFEKYVVRPVRNGRLHDCTARVVLSDLLSVFHALLRQFESDEQRAQSERGDCDSPVARRFAAPRSQRYVRALRCASHSNQLKQRQRRS